MWARSREPRTVGLWLYDHIQENGTSLVEAIDVLRSLGILSDLGMGFYGERKFSRYFSCTKRCIDSGEVLPLSG